MFVGVIVGKVLLDGVAGTGLDTTVLVAPISVAVPDEAFPWQLVISNKITIAIKNTIRAVNFESFLIFCENLAMPISILHNTKPKIFLSN